MTPERDVPADVLWWCGALLTWLSRSPDRIWTHRLPFDRVKAELDEAMLQ